MIEIKKKNELEALNIIHEALIKFFMAENKKLKLDPNIVKFCLRFRALDTILRHEISEELGVNAANYLLGGSQLYISSFFGLSNVVEPSHIYLNNDRAFYALYSSLMYEHEFPSITMQNVENCFHEHGRNKLSIEARTYSAVVADIVNISYKVFIKDLVENSYHEYVSSDLIFNEFMRLHGSTVFKQVDVYFTREMRAIKNGSNGGNKLTVYRGFEISDKDDVRSGRLKINNPVAHIQNAGKGMFYTTDKKIANAFAMNKFANRSDFAKFEERISSIKFILNNATFDFDKFMSRENRRAYIGRYEVDFKDILYTRIHLGESEIVAIPSKVNLVNYIQV